MHVYIRAQKSAINQNKSWMRWTLLLGYMTKNGELKNQSVKALNALWVMRWMIVNYIFGLRLYKRKTNNQSNKQRNMPFRETRWVDETPLLIWLNRDIIEVEWYISYTSHLSHHFLFSGCATKKLNHQVYKMFHNAFDWQTTFTGYVIVLYTHCREYFHIISINSGNLILHIIILTLISQWWRCPIKRHASSFFLLSRFHFILLPLLRYHIFSVWIVHVRCACGVRVYMRASECVVQPLRPTENEAHKSNRPFSSIARWVCVSVCVCVCSSFIPLELGLK